MGELVTFMVVETGKTLAAMVLMIVLAAVVSHLNIVVRGVVDRAWKKR